MTSWVFGYIQPDNLAFMFLSLAILLGLRATRWIGRSSRWLLMGLVLSLLLATKVQYFIAGAFPIFAWLTVCASTSNLGRGRIARLVLIAVIPIAGMGVLCSYITHTTPTAGPFGDVRLGRDFFEAAHSGVVELLSYAWSQLTAVYFTNFGLGSGLVSYWGSVSWLMTPVRFGNTYCTFLLLEFISFSTTIVGGLMLFRQLKVLGRIRRVGRRRSFRAAAWLLTRNLILTTYFTFISFILVLAIYAGSDVIKQGRYWLPFIVANMLCATTYVPGIFVERFRKAASKLVTSFLSGYSLLAAGFAIQALSLRFYVPPERIFPFERGVHVDARCADPGVEIPYSGVVSVSGSKDLVLCGWALDMSTGRLSRRSLSKFKECRPFERSMACSAQTSCRAC